MQKCSPFEDRFLYLRSALKRHEGVEKEADDKEDILSDLLPKLYFSYTSAMASPSEKNETSMLSDQSPEYASVAPDLDDEQGADDLEHALGAPNRRGIYLLPNLFTTGALAAGFYAILAGLEGHFEAAAIAIFVAMFFDGLDGRVARLTNTQSEFGVEYDSLSDMVSFGVAPAVLMYVWILEPLGKLGWSVSFIYVSCAALRLARFNVRVAGQDSRYFLGLASPAAAAVIASMVWSGSAIDVSHLTSTGDAVDLTSTGWVSLSLLAVLTGVIGLLMVSNVRYLSFKQIHFTHRVPFAVVLGLSLVIAVIMIDPPRVLLGLSLFYALGYPIWTVIKSAKTLSMKTLRRRFKNAPQSEVDDQEAASSEEGQR